MSPARLVQLAPGVLVGTSRFMATNTVIVTAGQRALVIDPGVHADELDALAVDVLRRRLDVVGGFATHAHWDHVLWHGDLGDVPRWASTRTATEAAAHHAELIDEAEATTPVDDALLGVLAPVEGALPWDGPEVHLVVHDAHAPGHAALWFPELGLLVAGDMGSDIEVPLLDPDRPGPEALAAHHAGLDALAAVGPVRWAITGHGHACDGDMWRRRLDADRSYLDELATGRASDDPRLCEPWLVRADEAMRAALDKRAWRRFARSLPAPDAEAAREVRAQLRRHLGEAPGLVGGYRALPGEIDLGDAVDEAHLVLPRLGDDGTVTWHPAGGPEEVVGPGLRQPTPGAPEVDPDQLDVLLVPGRLFDTHGIRLGRGGGHYDRLLPRLRPGVAAIGVTTVDRVVPRLPTEAHDAPMAMLATEAGVRAADRTRP